MHRVVVTVSQAHRLIHPLFIRDVDVTVVPVIVVVVVIAIVIASSIVIKSIIIAKATYVIVICFALSEIW